MEQPLFSVLILGIPERWIGIGRLLKKLESQIKKDNLSGKVEILCLLDNKIQTIAEKRNCLLKQAKGRYLAFLDDDDDISDQYFHSICSSIIENKDVDVISFKQFCRINGKKLLVSFNLNNPHEGLTLLNQEEYKPIKRPPYHICVWKTDLAQSEEFKQVYAENGQSCEDIDWCMRLYPKCRSSFQIDSFLHFYNYSEETTRSKLKQK